MTLEVVPCCPVLIRFYVQEILERQNMNFTYVLLYLIYILNDYISKPPKIKQITLFFNITAPRARKPFIPFQTIVFMSPRTRQPFIPFQTIVFMSPITWQPLLSFQLLAPHRQPSITPYLADNLPNLPT